MNLEKTIEHANFDCIGSHRADLLEAIIKEAIKEYKEVQDDIGTSKLHIKQMLTEFIA